VTIYNLRQTGCPDAVRPVIMAAADMVPSLLPFSTLQPTLKPS
jgi:hypothetical protein